MGSGKPTATDNIRVLEQAQEITYRPVTNGQEGEEERVFALRTDPLRLEMFNRHPTTGMRLDWQAPCAMAYEIFDRTACVPFAGSSCLCSASVPLPRAAS